ncbi:c-type cytochrome [Psychromonas antarctica]|jgi:cytochrome c553|uniref:c-type cytochrome n=1 Tax=Psychromonas antarctica TaxID=67573 RepID=UPI001EE8F3CE|nr:c-type cytochrome [Psychromonas antarctica]MCG6201167.1 cytochrome c4 [Psychromonas antarctica]
MNKLLMTLIGILSFSGIVQAEADIEAGKATAIACAACHGADGNSPSNLYPKLAGQHASYLEKQLQEFKSGKRNNAIMLGMAYSLSEQDMRNISAYYESQTTTPETIDAAIADAGQKLYMGGDLQRQIPACTACHGPRGNGLALAKFPKVSSQHPTYLKTQLESFRNKTRNNDQNSMMADIASKLTDADIELLSKYISALH